MTGDDTYLSSSRYASSILASSSLQTTTPSMIGTLRPPFMSKPVMAGAKSTCSFLQIGAKRGICKWTVPCTTTQTASSCNDVPTGRKGVPVATKRQARHLQVDHLLRNNKQLICATSCFLHVECTYSLMQSGTRCASASKLLPAGIARSGCN